MTARPGYPEHPGYPWQGVPAWGEARGQGYLLASTADRESAVDVLKTGFAEGRLTKDEYDARTGRALSARTLGDLARITADLPGSHLSAPPWRPAAPPARTNALAVGSLVCGLGQLFFGPLATIPAIVLGHSARREIRRTGEQGMGLATAGMLLGWAGAVFLVLVALMVVAAVATMRPGG